MTILQYWALTLYQVLASGWIYSLPWSEHCSVGINVFLIAHKLSTISLLELVYLFLPASIGFLLSLLNQLHPRVNMIAAQPPSCHCGKNRFPFNPLVQNVAQKCCIAIPKINEKVFHICHRQVFDICHRQVFDICHRQVFDICHRASPDKSSR